MYNISLHPLVILFMMSYSPIRSVLISIINSFYLEEDTFKY